jgi:hypothetical protein
MEDSEHVRFPEPVLNVLIGAGWFPGRRIPDSLFHEWITRLGSVDGFSSNPFAALVLYEFGGLRVHQSGPGVDYAREPFEILPILGVGERDRFRDFEPTVGSSLYPLGEGSGGHWFLAIDELGKVYGIMESIWLIGGSFDEAITNLILGVSSRLR